MVYEVHKIDLNFTGQKNSIASFLIKTEEGPILVESGPASTLKYLEQGLASHGYALSDVKHVFLTHIHLDHAGAAWCFAELGAKIYLHPLGYKHMHDPSRLLASATRIYGEMMDVLWGTLKPIPAEQLIQIDHLGEVNIGRLKFIGHYTPGHAKHHLAWQLGAELFTGDVGGVRIHGGPVVPPCPPPDIDIDLWLASLDHIASISDIERYHLTHCSSVDDLEHHLEMLRSTLKQYAAWVKPWVLEGRAHDEVLPEFLQLVKNLMMTQGLSESDADAYQVANPPQGSLSGVMRYWTKKLEA